jgi:hypothetical protein
MRRRDAGVAQSGEEAGDMAGGARLSH